MEIAQRKKRKPMSEINVVPYIDVMLVLLIIFMITAPLLNQGVELELPEANNEPLELEEEFETLIISVSAAGEFFMSVGVTGDDRQSITLETLGDQVQRIMGANPSIQVLLEGDAEANWQSMISVITTLQSSGVTNPSLITQPLNSN